MEGHHDSIEFRVRVRASLFLRHTLVCKLEPRILCGAKMDLHRDGKPKLGRSISRSKKYSFQEPCHGSLLSPANIQ